MSINKYPVENASLLDFEADIYSDYSYLKYMIQTRDALLNGVRRRFDGSWSLCIPKNFQEETEEGFLLTSELRLESENDLSLHLEIQKIEFEEDPRNDEDLKDFFDGSAELKCSTFAAKEKAIAWARSYVASYWPVGLGDEVKTETLNQTTKTIVAYTIFDFDVEHVGAAAVVCESGMYLIYIEFSYQSYLNEDRLVADESLDIPVKKLIVHFFEQFFQQIDFCK